MGSFDSILCWLLHENGGIYIMTFKRTMSLFLSLVMLLGMMGSGMLFMRTAAAEEETLHVAGELE